MNDIAAHRMTAVHGQGVVLDKFGGGISEVVAHVTRGGDRARRPGATAPIPVPAD